MTKRRNRKREKKRGEIIKHSDLTYSSSAETAFIDFLEPSSLDPKNLDESDAVENDSESSFDNDWLPNELTLPTKPLSLTSGNLTMSTSKDPESGLEREIYISAKHCTRLSWLQQENPSKHD